MTPHLSVFLLGPVEVRLDGEPLSGFEYNKVRALLAYLAVEGNRPQTRASLSDLLWPEMPESASRQNLSQALTQLRKVLGDKQADTPYLLTNVESVQLNPAASVDVDASRFIALISQAEVHAHRAWHLCSSCAEKLQQAVSLYHGDFLAHFFVSDSTVFEEWALQLRERLRQQMLSALERLVKYFEWHGAYERAVEMARMHVEMEHWRDDSHRELMRLLALSGQRTAALAQYEHLKRTLDAELDLQPEPETIELYEKIHAREALDSMRRFQPPISNLPLPPMPLIGRGADLEAVESLFHEGGRLLTITGAPGVGKTRFALEIAARMQCDFEEGVHFVDLGPLSDASQVPFVVMNIFGLKEQAGRLCTDLVKGYLRNKHLLLVFDNFEHMIVSAPFVADLLTACPDLKVLVTSRSALRIRAERIHLLEPLEAQEAVELFTERAKAVRTTFTIMEENVETILALCQHLDNLPLGIELVAVRARVFSTAELLRQLGSRLETQRTISRDLPERQSTLRNAIAWSYDRLSEEEQYVFAHLGVFLGGGTVEAVQAVVGEAMSVPLHLEALVEVSLVQSQVTKHETRFTLLETLREFACEQLKAKGGEETAQRRKADYFLTLAEQAEAELIGPNQKTWFDRLDRELANLRAVLSWSLNLSIDTHLRVASALEQFWIVRGHAMEIRTWIKQALPLNQFPHSEIQAKAQLVAGMLAAKQGDYVEAQVQLIQSHQSFMQLEDERGVARTHFYMGLTAEGQSDYPTAQAHYQNCLNLALEFQDWYIQAGALNGLGHVAFRQGDYLTTRFYSEQALRLYQDHHDIRDVAGLTLNLGVISYEQGDYIPAQEYTQTALTAAREFGDKYLLTLCLLNLGNILITIGDYAQACHLLEEAIAMQRARGDVEYLSAPLGTLGRALYHLGQLEKARACQVEALNLRVKAGDRRGIAVSFGNLAPIEFSQGKGERAARLLGAAEVIREEVGAPITPVRRLEYEQLVAAIRTALGDKDFEEAWATGRTLTLEQAVILALGQD